MKTALFLAILLLGMDAAAYTTSYEAYDINTLQPLQSANITASNSTAAVGTTTTDAAGQASQTVSGCETGCNMTYNIIRSGYESQATNVANQSASSTLRWYLSPSGTDGIIRVNVNDLTGTVSEYCVYFRENMRLKGCASVNETVLYVIGKEYLIRPKAKLSQAINSPYAVKALMPYFLSWLLGAAFVIIPLLVLVVLFRRAWKK